jgi:putative ATPase
MNYQHLTTLLRPQKLDDFVGQSHLIGINKPLSLMLQSGKLSSMLLYGPPGIGKTSFALLLGKLFNVDLQVFSATADGIANIKEIIKRSSGSLMKTVIFLDEIHRFNKAQQDIFLPLIENNEIILIAATTENPSFTINNALLSRLHSYHFQPLTFDDLNLLIDKALPHLATTEINQQSRQLLIDFADSDARKLLNILDLLKNINPLTTDIIQNTLPENLAKFDKQGDLFYEYISALHKSVRGSNVDGALYWLAVMLQGGADRNYLARRIVRMAFEDIGLADIKAADFAVNAAKTYEMLGSPEGELALAQAVIYLCVAPKSNAGYNAFNQAMAFVKNDKTRDVPNHLKNAPTKFMQKNEIGKGYRYAHNEPHAYAAGEQYLPAGLKSFNWYQPTDRGLEIKIKNKLAFLKSLDDELLKE